MTDKKISELTELTSAEDTDVFPIVDTSANETKKIKMSNILALTKSVTVNTEYSATAYLAWTTIHSYGTLTPVNATSQALKVKITLDSKYTTDGSGAGATIRLRITGNTSGKTITIPIVPLTTDSPWHAATVLTTSYITYTAAEIVNFLVDDASYTVFVEGYMSSSTPTKLIYIKNCTIKLYF